MDETLYVSVEELENDADELIGFRPNVDANEFLPPLPHGDYEALLSFDSTDPAKRWIKDNTTKGEPKKYYKTTLKAVTDGNADDVANGREFNHYCSTLVRRGGTTGAQAVLQGIGVSQQEIETNKTHAGQTGLLNRILDSGNAVATCEIDWEASYYDAEFMDPETGEKIGKEYFRLRGMERFPEAVEGEDDYDKSLLTLDGKKRFYPWVDLDISDMDNPVVVLPSEKPVPGRNVQRCFARNVLRRFRTRTTLTAVSSGPAGAPGPRAVPAATGNVSAGAAPSAPAAPASGGPPRGAAPRPAPTRR